MTRTGSRVLLIPCPLRISPLALRSHLLRATPRPRQWPPLQLWHPSNHHQHYLHRTLLSVRPLLIRNIRSNHPRLKHLIYNGRCPRQQQRLRNQTNDRTHTSARVVHPILRRIRREEFSINLCTNRQVQTDPAVFNGRLFSVSLVLTPRTFCVK